LLNHFILTTSAIQRQIFKLRNNTRTAVTWMVMKRNEPTILEPLCHVTRLQMTCWAVSYNRKATPAQIVTYRYSTIAYKHPAS